MAKGARSCQRRKSRFFGLPKESPVPSSSASSWGEAMSASESTISGMTPRRTRSCLLRPSSRRSQASHWSPASSRSSWGVASDRSAITRSRIESDSSSSRASKTIGGPFGRSRHLGCGVGLLRRAAGRSSFKKSFLVYMKALQVYALLLFQHLIRGQQLFERLL